MVDGTKATKITGKVMEHEGPGPIPGTPEEVVIFAKNGLLYTMVYLPIDNQDYSEVFSDMVASFKTL
jgi:hypothetical protein